MINVPGINVDIRDIGEFDQSVGTVIHPEICWEWVGHTLQFDGLAVRRECDRGSHLFQSEPGTIRLDPPGKIHRVCCRIIRQTNDTIRTVGRRATIIRATQTDIAPRAGDDLRISECHLIG